MRAPLRSNVPLVAFLAGLALAACAAGAPAPASTSPTSRSLAGLPVAVVTVGATPLRLAVTDDARTGLAGVADLDGLDGMLFDYGREVAPAAHPFWMAGVRIPIEIAFFDASGWPVDRVAMEPCGAGPDCPAHIAAAPFRWVIETPPGTLDPGGRLAVTGP